jgi:hypothetical protein
LPVAISAELPERISNILILLKTHPSKSKRERDGV